MTTRMLTERVADLANLDRVRAAGHSLPFLPQDLAHLYIKLEFKNEYENARSTNNALGFLRSVARASNAAHQIAMRTGGILLEVQGSMLHVALPNGLEVIHQYAANLHSAYRKVFNNSQGRVAGWRMAADGGRTLVVAGQSVHGDDSYVSLGNSANRPAKHIYAQLELPEEQRSLKRFSLGLRQPQTDRWQSVDLSSRHAQLDEATWAAATAGVWQPQVEYVQALQLQSRVATRAAAPIPPGDAASAGGDRPHIYFGWVMRCDLDGFTARVEQCFDSDQRLQELAAQFYAIMDEAALFVNRHGETLAQLPWAGDNFTSVALSETLADYQLAAKRRVVELSLDFNKDILPTTLRGGFRGWAHAVAGGDVHGNAAGNVFLARLNIDGRRFLVGVGEGFGRSAQAFSDVNPGPGEIVVYEPDWAKLEDSYKQTFEPAINVRGEQSSLYRIAKADALVRVLARMAALGRPTEVTIAPGRTQVVAPRPHCV